MFKIKTNGCCVKLVKIETCNTKNHSAYKEVIKIDKSIHKYKIILYRPLHLFK